jgi:hypothetical protein
MMEKLFGCTLPDAIMFYGVGCTMLGVLAPFDNNADTSANRGECYTSVHPAQIVSTMFEQGCAGMPGIPVDFEGQAAEMKFSVGGSNTVYVPRGDSDSIQDKSGAIKLDVGQGMLGHSVILRRDDNVVGAGHYRLAFTNPKVEGESGSMVNISFEDFPRHMRRAFVPEAAAGRQYGFNGAARLNHNHIELFADFEAFTAMNLQLGLNSQDNGNVIAGNSVLRSQLPGYIAVAVKAATIAGPSGAPGMVVFSPRKKMKRIDEGN